MSTRVYEASADWGLGFERSIERLFEGLFRDGYLADDLPTRFEVWGRVSKLAEDASQRFHDLVEQAAEELAGEHDMDETDAIIQELEDLVCALEQRGDVGKEFVIGEIQMIISTRR